MDAAGLERLAGHYSGTDRIDKDVDGVGMVVIGDYPSDRSFSDKERGLVADNEKNKGN